MCAAEFSPTFASENLSTDAVNRTHQLNPSPSNIAARSLHVLGYPAATFAVITLAGFCGRLPPQILPFRILDSAAISLIQSYSIGASEFDVAVCISDNDARAQGFAFWRRVASGSYASGRDIEWWWRGSPVAERRSFRGSVSTLEERGADRKVFTSE